MQWKESGLGNFPHEVFLTDKAKQIYLSKQKTWVTKGPILSNVCLSVMSFSLPEMLSSSILDKNK